MWLLRDEAVEVFGILCLTTKLHVICWHEVARGCLDSTVIHPREVFKAAILVNAATTIAAHNLPSGDPQPSPDDIDLSRRLSAAGALLGIELLDPPCGRRRLVYQLPANGQTLGCRRHRSVCRSSKRRGPYSAPSGPLRALDREIVSVMR